MRERKDGEKVRKRVDRSSAVSVSVSMVGGWWLVGGGGDVRERGGGAGREVEVLMWNGWTDP